MAAKTPANKVKKTEQKDRRTFLYLGDFGEVLNNYFMTDPRFPDRSKAARHLMELGIKHDKKNREKALEAVKV